MVRTLVAFVLLVPILKAGAFASPTDLDTSFSIRPPTVLTMCVDPHWPPYEYISNQGIHEGIAAALLKLITEKSQIQFQLVRTQSWQESLNLSKQGKCDVLSFVNQTSERSQWLDFTQPYFSDVNVILSRKDHPNIVDLSAFTNELIVLPEGYMLDERIKQDYPNLRVTTVATETDALTMVEQNYADLTIRPLITTLTQLNHGKAFFKIAGELPNYENKMRIGVVKAKSDVIPVLNNAINNISAEQVQTILNTYNPNVADEEVDYQYIYQLILMLIAITIICFLWLLQNRKHTAEIEKLKSIVKHEKINRQHTVIKLDESESRYLQLIESAHEGIVVISNNQISFFNAAFKNMTGYEIEECRHFSFLQFIVPDDRGQWLEFKSSGDTNKKRIRLLHHHGAEIWVEISSVNIEWKKSQADLYFIHNVTDRVLYEQKIEHLAQHDILTNLPNRALFSDRIEQAILLAEREQNRLAILFIDVDKFKQINDTYGHHIGDFILKTIAQRISNTLRKSDSAARLGGDEFLALLHQAHIAIDAIKVANKICDIIRTPIYCNETLTVEATVSIGVSIFPDHATDAFALVKAADEAMYRAKAKGGNAIEIYAELQGLGFKTESGKVPRFEWHSHYRSGHSGIDNEHRELFEFANQLAESIVEVDSNPEQFNAVYKKLLDHIKTHFEHEEAILKRHNFLQLHHHKLLHDELLEKAKNLYSQMKSKEVSPENLVDFLANDVLTKHLLHDDSLFFSILESRK